MADIESSVRTIEGALDGSIPLCRALRLARTQSSSSSTSGSLGPSGFPKQAFSMIPSSVTRESIVAENATALNKPLAHN